MLSEHILAELARTLTDPYFAARRAPDEATIILARLSAVASVTVLTVEVRGIATHPEGVLVLSTALSDQASILCTRDKQPLRLRSYQTVAILSPGELLALLEGAAPT